MFSREARRRNKERLLQATGIHKEAKDGKGLSEGFNGEEPREAPR